MKRIKNFLVGIIVLAAAIVAVVMLINDDFSHIEDTNGVDNFALQTITDENIIEMDMGSMGLKESTSSFTNTVTYSSNEFSGVAELYNTTYFKSDIIITMNHAAVTEGNFRIVLVVDDEIVHEFKLNELTQTFELNDVSGNVSLRIAGESAAFTLDFDII